MMGKNLNNVWLEAKNYLIKAILKEVGPRAL